MTHKKKLNLLSSLLTSIDEKLKYCCKNFTVGFTVEKISL